MNTSATKEVRATLLTRPLRMALLLDPASQSALRDIDEWIRFSSGLWGGRYNPIVPIDNGAEIRPGWWSLLRESDPDVICAASTIDDSLVARINRFIAPSRIFENADRARLQDGSLRFDNWPIRALPVFDIPKHWWENGRALSPPHFFLIYESARLDSSPFILRNFGVLSGGVFGKLAFSDLPFEEVDANSVSPAVVLEKLGAVRNGVTPLRLAAAYAKRLVEGNYSGLNGPFQLVVGESAADLIHYWNRGLTSALTAAHRTVWISSEMLADKEQLEALCRWLETRVLPQGNPHSSGFVASYSVPSDELGRAAGILCERLKLPFQSRALSDESDFKLREPSTDIWAARRTAILQIPETGATLSAAPPPFLTSDSSGFGWMADLEIEPLQNSGLRVSSNAPLPRRYTVGRLFFGGFESSLSGRVTAMGHPSRWVSTESVSIDLKIPAPLAILRACFDRNATNTATQRPHNARFARVQISEKGRYLSGFVRLFSGVTAASGFLEDRLWSEVFERLSGKPRDRIHQAEKRIREELIAAFGPLEQRRPPTDEQLADASKRLSGRLLLPGPIRESIDSSRLSQIRGRVKRDRAQVRDELGFLLRNRILVQGAEVLCHACGSSTFYRMDELRQEVPCRGCWEPVFVEPAPDWAFQLNALIREGMRRHGLVPVVRLLGQLGRSSMVEQEFVPSLDVFEIEKTDPFTDLDIAAVIDGQVVLGEVKSSPTGYAPEDFEKLEIIGEDLWPDEIVVASGPGDWPPSTEALFQALVEKLGPKSIRVSRVALV